MSMDSNLQLVFQEIGGAIKQKQDKLVSASTIKTVNGQSLLGNGDINISGSQGVYVQSSEPSLSAGQKALWIETLQNGNFRLWIKQGKRSALCLRIYLGR